MNQLIDQEEIEQYEAGDKYIIPIIVAITLMLVTWIAIQTYGAERFINDVAGLF